MKNSFKLIILLSAAAVLSGCFSYPRWVENLPEDKEIYFPLAPGYKVRQDFTGTWKRTVETRFGIRNRVAVSDGTEEIHIANSGTTGYTYEKTHIYSELVSGKHQEIHYTESGTIQVMLPYLLFKPEKALIYKSPRKRILPSRQIITRKDLTISAVTESAMKETDPPPSLLFYYDPARRMLLPMVYDRFNRYYDFGIVEGTTGKYDHSSDFFMASVRRYADLRIHSHGYKFSQDYGDF